MSLPDAAKAGLFPFPASRIIKSVVVAEVDFQRHKPEAHHQATNLRLLARIRRKGCGLISKIAGGWFSGRGGDSEGTAGKVAEAAGRNQMMLERLLNGYSGGAIDEAVFKEKSASLKIEEAELEERLTTMPDVGAEMGKWAIQAFDFNPKKRPICDAVRTPRTGGPSSIA